MPACLPLSLPSRFARDLGAFINLESTGPWGPDVVFQHTGDWTLAAYARSAPHPRGTTLAQDFFDLGGWLASSWRKEELHLSSFFFLALEHMLLLVFFWPGGLLPLCAPNRPHLGAPFPWVHGGWVTGWIAV